MKLLYNGVARAELEKRQFHFVFRLRRHYNCADNLRLEENSYCNMGMRDIDLILFWDIILFSSCSISC